MFETILPYIRIGIQILVEAMSILEQLLLFLTSTEDSIADRPTVA